MGTLLPRLLVALVLGLALPAGADSAPMAPGWSGPTLVFPTADTSGNPLPKTGPKALKGCKVWQNAEVDGAWINPAGKTQVQLVAPTLLSALPWKWTAACCNSDCTDPMTWGPSATGRLEAVFTTP